MDFRYLAQMPAFDEHILQQLDVALQLFHDHKDSIIAAGVREHFCIPKLELLQHIVPSIQDLGAVMQWITDATEHAHVTEVKNPAHARNNQNYYSQIACHLDCADKCFQFDLATQMATVLRIGHQADGVGDDDDDDDGEQHEPDSELWNTLLYNSLTHKVVDYFQIACTLANKAPSGVPQPLQTFASTTTAIHLALKPALRMTIPEASEHFGLPDLRHAILGYLDRCSNGKPHNVAGRRPAAFRSILSTEQLQIWLKVRVQVRTWHDSTSVEPAQTLHIAPPSQQHPSGLYNCAIISSTANSDWPVGGLNSTLTCSFLSYV